METIAGILFGIYTIFYVVLMAWYFFNPKPLKKYMKYSTIGLILLIIFLLIALGIDGSLFKDLGNTKYF